jgi:hypothetical protein
VRSFAGRQQQIFCPSGSGAPAKIAEKAGCREVAGFFLASKSAALKSRIDVKPKYYRKI